MKMNYVIVTVRFATVWLPTYAFVLISMSIISIVQGPFLASQLLGRQLWLTNPSHPNAR